MNEGLLLILYGVCAIVSALFSAAETALTSVSDAAVFRLGEEGRRGARRLERLRRDLPRTLGTLLVGNTLANAAAGTIGAAAAISLLGEKWGVVAATAGTTALLLVLSEVTPKTLAAGHPEEVALALSRPLELAVSVLVPVSGLLTRLARFLLRPLAASPAPLPGTTDAEVKSLITFSHERGGLERDEKEILQAVLDFGDVPVRDAMVPRARMVSLPVAASFDTVEAVSREHRYSRYPVWRENPDDIVGILHVKDLFDVTDAEEKTFELARYLRPAVFVPELKRAGDLLREMRRRRFHMAVVMDERGTLAGLVTLEDLIEQIIGDIADEHDEPARRPVADGTSLILEGAYPLTSLERDLGISLEEPQVETAAGFLLRRFGRIPRTGARIRVGDLEFLVERATPRAVERIRITRGPAGVARERAGAREAS